MYAKPTQNKTNNLEENEASKSDDASPTTDDNAPEPVKLTPVEIQQEYFENLSDCDWILYKKENHNHLLQNIAYALFGSPCSEGELLELDDSHEAKLEGYKLREQEQVMNVYKNICVQSKFSQNQEDIYMSVIMVVCAKPKPVGYFKIQPKNYWIDLHKRNDICIWSSPVFKIRKCIPCFADGNCCKLYIDEQARVYESWDLYLSNNIEPACVMIAPENGKYTGELIDDTVAVKLTVVPSPELGLKARVLSTTDTVNTIASIGSLGILGATLFTPIAPAVLLTATVATIGTGVYGVVRSSLHLRDRTTHQQTISPTNSEARGSWINIAASTVGVAASRATTALSKSASAGTNMTKTGKFLVTSVDVLRHANLVTGGAGVVHGLVNFIVKYSKYNETPTKLEIFQFTTATLFFFHAAMSNKTAQNIVEEAQGKALNEYRDSLRSNRHRKMFDKILAETKRVQGTIQGNTEVIKGIQNISDKNEFFASALKINKDVNQNKLRISMTSDGKVNLNSQQQFDPTDLYNIGKDSRSQLFESIGPAKIDSSNVSTKITTPDTSVGIPSTCMVSISPGEVLQIGAFAFQICSEESGKIAELLEDLSREAYNNFMIIAFNLISKLVPEDIAKLKFLNPNDDLLTQVIHFIFNYMKDKRPMGETCMESDNFITIMIKEFFQNGLIRSEIILKLKNIFLKWISDNLKKILEAKPTIKLIECVLCQGIRYSD